MAERGDLRFEPEDALCRALHGRKTIDVVAAGQVGVLQHGVHGPPDRRAVATTLPRRQVEVDALLGQSGIDRRGRRSGRLGRRGRGGWPTSSSAPMPRRSHAPARRSRPSGPPTARSPAPRTSEAGPRPADRACAPRDRPRLLRRARLRWSPWRFPDRSTRACGAATPRDDRWPACRRRRAGAGARHRPSARRVDGSPRTARCRAQRGSSHRWARQQTSHAPRASPWSARRGP